jgi:hypothetical protein
MLCNLKDVSAKAKLNGWPMITIVNGGEGGFTAICCDSHGEPKGPRSWNPLPTPEEAIADLGKRIDA